MKNYLILTLVIIPIVFFSCRRKGCNDNNALNYAGHFKKNDGSCKYSGITFYALYNTYLGSPVTSIDINVDSTYIGTINVGTTGNHPAGPSGCHDVNTVFYQIVNMSAITWYATIHFTGGGTATTSGSSGPNHFTECIKINVTPTP